MAYESIVPNPVKFIPNSNVEMQAIPATALEPFAGADINADNYVAQTYVYDKENKDRVIKKDTTRKRNKKSKPKAKIISGITTKVKPLVPRQSNPNLDFILGKQKKNDSMVVMGINLGKIGDAFKKRKKIKG